MKILVTGGAGFIGANLVRMLIGKSHDVTVVDDFRVRQNYLFGLDIKIIDDSIERLHSRPDIIRGMDAIVHLAGQASPTSAVLSPLNDFMETTVGGVKLLDASLNEGVKRFVFVSSWAAGNCFLLPYGASSLAIESYCKAYYDTYKLGTVSLRLGNVYGPFSKHKSSAIAGWFNDINRGGEISLDIGVSQDFIYVSDVCQAIAVAIEGDICGKVFQVETGIETSTPEIAEIINSLTGVEIKVTKPRVSAVKTGETKADALPRWKPEVKLEDGLRHTWKWFKDNFDQQG